VARLRGALLENAGKGEREMLIEKESNTTLPRMIKIGQQFPNDTITDLASHIERELDKATIRGRLSPGMKVAIGIGSRGIGQILEIVKLLVQCLKNRGVDPFVVPAMGSHGGATAEGQLEILESYGISPEVISAPIMASMDVTKVGTLPDGLDLYFSRAALDADAIIPVNRIKPHTSFQGDIGSGLMKMLVIGFGKHVGASSVHQWGADQFILVIPEAAEFFIQNLPIAFGLAIVENAYGFPTILEAIPADEIPVREKDLFSQAREKMARLPFGRLDVLVIEECGKNISGPCIDPNVTGRFAVRYLSRFPAEPEISRLVALNLTEESHGNATGISVCDVITRRLADRINREDTYINAITSSAPEAARIPVIASSDREAIRIAIRTCYRVRPSQARLVRIKNTAQLDSFLVSEVLMEEVRSNPMLTVEGHMRDWQFDRQGNLLS
jgi:hypothetical protein